MLRWLLIRAADSRSLAGFAGRDPITRDVVSRYVAGESTADGLDAARTLASRGIALTLDHVGEHITDLSDAEAVLVRQAYRFHGRHGAPLVG